MKEKRNNTLNYPQLSSEGTILMWVVLNSVYSYGVVGFHSHPVHDRDHLVVDEGGCNRYAANCEKIWC